MMKTTFVSLLVLTALTILISPVDVDAQERPLAEINPAPATLPMQNLMQKRSAMREVYQSRHLTIQVRRFETIDGPPPFILDTTGKGALFRYERGGEVLVLTPVYTTRGDVLYKNDQGRVVLRLQRVGSATLFPRPRSQGIIAWTTGSATHLKPPRVSLEKMTDILERIANDLAGVLDHDVAIAVNGATEETAWLYLDAANNLKASLHRLTRHRVPGFLQDINRIEIKLDTQPSALVTENIVHLTIAPELGFAGRPSSLQIQSSLILNNGTLPDGPPSLPIPVNSDEITVNTSRAIAEEVTFTGAR